MLCRPAASISVWVAGALPGPQAAALCLVGVSHAGHAGSAAGHLGAVARLLAGFLQVFCAEQGRLLQTFARPVRQQVHTGLACFRVLSGAKPAALLCTSGCCFLQGMLCRAGCLSRMLQCCSLVTAVVWGGLPPARHPVASQQCCLGHHGRAVQSIFGLQIVRLQVCGQTAEVVAA